MSEDGWKEHPAGIKKAVKKDSSEERSLCNCSTESQSMTAELPLASLKIEVQFGCHTDIWRSAIFEV